MPQMRATTSTAHFRALHTEAVVFEEFDRFGPYALVEAGPPTVGLKLCAALKELVAAGPAAVHAVTPLAEEFAGARALGRGLPQNGVFLGRKARAPLFVAESEIVVVGFVARGAHAASVRR